MPKVVTSFVGTGFGGLHPTRTAGILMDWCLVKSLKKEMSLGSEK
jgi:hypothetical protein